MEQAMTQNEMKEYKEAKDLLKKRFISKKTGDQTQYDDMSKLYKPLMDTQKELSKAVQDKIVENKDTLVPFIQELKKRNDITETFQSLPFYADQQQGIMDVPQKQKVDIVDVPQKQKVDIINLDKNLNETDIKILQSLAFDLPMTLYKKEPTPSDLDKIFKQITSKNICNGKTNKQKHPELYKQIKTTLEKYKKAVLSY